MICTREERFLPVKSIVNARDIGGYPTKEGFSTKKHRFIRTAALTGISEADIQAIKDYGISIDIDLRGQDELKQDPDPLNEVEGIDYVNIDLFEKLDLMHLSKDTAPEIKDVSDMYLWLLEGAKKQLYTMYKLFVDNPDKGILFHCSAGKDRTGTTAAVLLAIAGVDKEDIIQDYVETFENNYPMFKDMYEKADDFMKRMLESRRESIERFLDYIDATYGSCADYLLSIGLTKEELNILKNSFIEK